MAERVANDVGSRAGAAENMAVASATCFAQSARATGPSSSSSRTGRCRRRKVARISATPRSSRRSARSEGRGGDDRAVARGDRRHHPSDVARDRRGRAAGIAIAFGLALVQSRRLARPLVDLATTAARIGSGDPRPMYRRYGIRELDQVGGVLDDSVARVAEMLASERRFATDASHQLRTPLTALSMRLEEILVADDPETIKEEATVAIAQVERLAEVVDRLLAEARQSRTAHAVRCMSTSSPGSRSRSGRSLRAGGAGARPRGQAIGDRPRQPGGLSQVLATLLENSLVHGGGTTSVLIRTTATKVVIEVADQGPGVPPRAGRSGSSSDRSVVTPAPGWALPSPATWRKPTVVACSCSKGSQRCSRCSLPGRWLRISRSQVVGTRRQDPALGPSRPARSLAAGPSGSSGRSWSTRGHPFRGTRRYRRVRDRAENPGAVADEPERRREHQADDVGGDVVREREVNPRT